MYGIWKKNKKYDIWLPLTTEIWTRLGDFLMVTFPWTLKKSETFCALPRGSSPRLRRNWSCCGSLIALVPICTHEQTDLPAIHMGSTFSLGMSEYGVRPKIPWLVILFSIKDRELSLPYSYQMIIISYLLFNKAGLFLVSGPRISKLFAHHAHQWHRHGKRDHNPPATENDCCVSATWWIRDFTDSYALNETTQDLKIETENQSMLCQLRLHSEKWLGVQPATIWINWEICT